MIKATVDVHLERKITHLLSILGMALIHHFAPLWISWTILLGIGVPFLIFDFFRRRNEKLRQLTLKLFGAIMRRKEINGIAGTTYLLIGTMIIFFFFPHNIVSLSLLFLACADPLASVVGLKYGSLKIIGKKTFEGSLAAFVICFLIAFIFYYNKSLMTDHLLIASLLSGVIGSLSELIPIGKLDDNFTQPVASSLLLYALFSLYGGLS
jgi:dolichol kinase